MSSSAWSAGGGGVGAGRSDQGPGKDYRGGKTWLLGAETQVDLRRDSLMQLVRAAYANRSS